MSIGLQTYSHSAVVVHHVVEGMLIRNSKVRHVCGGSEISVEF
jgi:hypothetical protein